MHPTELHSNTGSSYILRTTGVISVHELYDLFSTIHVGHIPGLKRLFPRGATTGICIFGTFHWISLLDRPVPSHYQVRALLFGSNKIGLARTDDSN